jgi:hypothetical protein
VSREDIVAALLAAAKKLGPVSLRLRQRGFPAVANELDEVASDLASAARGQLEPIRTSAVVVDKLRARATFLHIRAQVFAAAELTSILRALASVADAELDDTAVGIPVIDDEMVDTNTIVVDEPKPSR